MKPYKVLCLSVSLCAGALLAAPTWSATCSGGANCTACANCSGCGHCSKRGGSCSVCRPDLYKSTPKKTTPQQSTPSRAQSQSARNVKVPAKWSDKVVGVTDGDTVTVMHGSTPVRIRLYGIDAPESNQAFGSVAKQKLSELVFGKAVTVTNTGTDRYGRVLAWLHLGKVNVNASMVRNGHAWHYKQYSPKEMQLAQYQALAQKEKRGLWRDAQPVAPWDFRR